MTYWISDENEIKSLHTIIKKRRINCGVAKGTRFPKLIHILKNDLRNWNPLIFVKKFLFGGRGTVVMTYMYYYY